MDANSNKTPPNSPSKKENMIGMKSVAPIGVDNVSLKANVKDKNVITTNTITPVAANIIVTPAVNENKAAKRKSLDVGNTLDHKNRVDKSPLTPKARKRSSLFSLQSPEMLTPLIRSLKDQEIVNLDDNEDHNGCNFSPEPLAKKGNINSNNEQMMEESDNEFSDLSKSVKSRVTYAYERYKMINSPISPTRESAYTKFANAPSYKHSISGIGGVTPHSNKNFNTMNTMKYSRNRRLSSSYQEMDYIDDTDNTNSAYEAFMKAIQSSPRFENKLETAFQKSPQISTNTSANTRPQIMGKSLDKNKKESLTELDINESEPENEAQKKLTELTSKDRIFESDAAESLVNLAKHNSSNNDKT